MTMKSTENPPNGEEASSPIGGDLARSSEPLYVQVPGEHSEGEMKPVIRN